MKLLIFAFLPLLAYGYDRVCVARDGSPRSTKPFQVPLDCKKFHQCSNGYLSTQDCADGTVFNPDLRVCDYPNNVPSCGSSSKVIRVNVCENEQTVLICPTGKAIWVLNAVYGRSDSQTCPSKYVKTTACAADGSSQKIKVECNGKNSCIVEATNSKFGDPCVGTYKYLQITYVCGRQPKWTKATVCEGKEKTLSCPANHVIVAKGGFYGRGNGATCPSTYVKTTKCFAQGSFWKLRNSCHGKNSCTISASNSVFGDPCYGTYKYVQFMYKCRAVRATNACVTRNGEAISSKPRWKAGDCENYYQCDHGKLLIRPCADGTSFNPKKGVCDHSKNVPGCA